MLYTRKGDQGTTKTFGCDQRISKSSALTEALGTVDEINSLLGLCKVKSYEQGLKTDSGLYFSDIIAQVQQNLFIIQAELAGADKSIVEEKILEIENIIDSIEKQLPPIKTFFVSGGTEIASLFDYSRTVARRAERRVVVVKENNTVSLSSFTMAYLNRLSSLLYALARLSNHLAGIKEDSPHY